MDEVDITTDHIAGRPDDLRDGEMKELFIGAARLVLARVAGRFYAVGGVCPHYGAPLAEGLLCGSRLICPWHMGSFDVRTGQLLDPPPLDCLPTYEVRVEGDRILVRVPATLVDRKLPDVVAAPDAAADGRTFAILGAGAAGVSAAQTLRREGFRGRLILISRESELPYDRPNLTKEYLSEKPFDHPMLLRPESFYEAAGIERWRRLVTRVESRSKTVCFEDGSTLHYDALLLATGGEPKFPGVPGEKLTGVFTIRTRGDVDRLRDATRAMKRGGRVVVMGSSFIGMEAAASLRERGLDVTVISPTAMPFEKTLGGEVGRVFQRLHEEKGVRFKSGRKITRFEGDVNRSLTGVLLDDGHVVPARLAVIGIGVRPATSMLKDIELASDGGVTVDQFLRCGDGLYAAGDIARFPDARSGRTARIEHWRVAEQQGETAARNMVGASEPFMGVAYFWSFQFDVGFDFVGNNEGYDEIRFDGDLAKRDFIACYLAGGKILAAGGFNRTPTLQALHELWRQGRPPSAEEVLGGADLASMARKGAGESVGLNQPHLSQ